MPKNAAFLWCALIRNTRFSQRRLCEITSTPTSLQDLFCMRASTKAIVSPYNNRLSADAFGDIIPKTIDHVVPEVGGATVEPGDLNMVIK